MMTSTSTLIGIHHDGSGRYVSNVSPKIGDEVHLTLRVPKSADAKSVALRTTPDGEGHYTEMAITGEDELSHYWGITIQITMPVTHYRFEIMLADGKYHYNGLGVSRANMPDLFDFKLLANFQAPSWVTGAVFYQIFPDRFRNGDPSISPQDGEWSNDGHTVKLKDWDELPVPFNENGSLDFFGGDLIGIQQKLDYLQDLGINALYLTPIFPSRSNHRYNIDDFYNVDEHLGGNQALIDLSNAMHERGMKLILDITPNHTSNTGEWFTSAQADENSPYADFYTFNQRPDDYVAWLNVRTLPKLNYASQKLRETMYEGDGSIFRHWLRAPYHIDGWRLDVYNMTARQGALQLNKDVGQGIRRAVKQENPEAYLFGEHFFDGTPHLQGDEMDATMNYHGFNIPLWRWLKGFDYPYMKDENPLPSETFDEQLRNFRAPLPWAIARMQFHQLGSHDTYRILNAVGKDKAFVKLATALLLSYLGVPCIYYGDEIGMEGNSDPDNRRPMIWDAGRWDHDLRAYHRRLIELRKATPAFVDGGYQTIHAQGDVWAFVRGAYEQQVLVVGYRGAGVEALQIPVVAGGLADGTRLKDLISGVETQVEGGYITLTDVPHATAYWLEVVSV
jgi:alpha-glucosidase